MNIILLLIGVMLNFSFGYVLDQAESKIENAFLKLKSSGIPNNNQTNQFVILIDSGSSGSRLMVYSWLNSPGSKNTLPEIVLGTGTKNEVWSYKEHPGIHDTNLFSYYCIY